MSSRHTFFKGKASAATMPNITFRFNRLDEEVEEVSTKTKQPTPAQSSVHSCQEEDQEINQINFETSSSVQSVAVMDNEAKNDTNHEEKCSYDQNEMEVNTLPNESKKIEPTKELVKESVKDYLSRFGKRACSLDVETDQGETWPFFKDLKGRITKNLEECKDVVKGEKLKVNDELMERLSLSKQKSLTELEETSEKEVGAVCPSFEALESLSKQSFNEPQDIGEERIKVSDKQPLIVASKNKFSLPKKKLSSKPELNMTLSSLMAQRSGSIEDNTLKSSQNIEIMSDISSVITSETVSSTVSKSSSMSTSLVYIYCLLCTMKGWLFSPVIIAILACFLLPLPSSLFGFIVGVILSMSFTFRLMKPTSKKGPLELPDYSKMPPLTIDVSENDSENEIFKGWMNELQSEYDPNTYHVNSTHSVYIRLDGAHLRISHPKTNIPKRAMFNEQRHDLAFIFQRHYDITGATVELLPHRLAKKRMWSKKYPICLTVCDPKLVISSAVKGSTSSDPLSSTSKPHSSKESTPVKKYEPKNNEKGEIAIYLFARTDREKDDWYRRFLKGSRLKMLKSHSPVSSPNIVGLKNISLENKRALSVDLGCLQMSSSYGNLHEADDTDFDDEPFAELNFDKQLKFEFYMSQLLSAFPSDHLQPKKGTNAKNLSSTTDYASPVVKPHPAQNLLWLNAFIGRLFFDFLTDEFWGNVVSDKIQKKLSKIKLPNFVDELKITELNLGAALPKIHRTSNPVVDRRGIWIDLDISYDGSFQMSLETKLNLMRLQKTDEEHLSNAESKEFLIPEKSHMYNSEEEDSAESSDEDVPLPDIQVNTGTIIEESTSPSTFAGSSTGKKIIRFVDKIAQSSYFQHVTKNKFVKRAMVEVSNTPIVLTVEVHWLTGTLALNIPPMPTDRLWYGFRKNPSLSIVARPKLGCHTVTITHFTEWIEKKLVLEFQKMLVMPNMDDLLIPIMQSGMD